MLMEGIFRVNVGVIRVESAKLRGIFRANMGVIRVNVRCVNLMATY